MFTPAEMAEFRADALGRMFSRATVRRETGNWITVNDREVPEWAAVEADVPLRLGGTSGAGQSRTETTPGGELQTAIRVASFPHDRRYRDGDLVEIVAGENAGLVLSIVDATAKDQATAYRVQVVEVQRPEEWG